MYLLFNLLQLTKQNPDSSSLLSHEYKFSYEFFDSYIFFAQVQ